MSVLVSLGLPESGKSTFLAALWHVLESKEIPSALRQCGLQPDREYLNAIRDAWVVFEPVPRTEIPVASVAFDLADEAGELAGRVRFPDLPGETFNAQWTDRFWSDEFDEQVRSAAGFLLFLSPDYDAPTLIREANRRLSALPGAGATGAPREERAWDARRAPTEAKLVELLQFLADARTSSPAPLALIVSAWDRAERQRGPDGVAVTTPQSWVRGHMPLLWQFLTANPEIFRVRWYGVSAQGGELSDAKDMRRLQQYEVTAERIRVVEDAREETHDPTRPLRWLLEQAGRGT